MHKRPYRGPIILVCAGALLPLVLGVILAFATNQPECPSGYTQEQVDATNCTIGANMSFVWVILSLPVAALAVLGAIIWGVIIHRRHR